MDNTFDRLFYGEGSLIAGLDESGVSDIAGPLVAACVILPKMDPRPQDYRIFEIADSKTIPDKYRKSHAEVIWNTAYAIGIGEVPPVEIDAIGGLAPKIAMLRAVHACKRLSNKKQVKPDFMIVDGHKQVPINIKQLTVKDGDKKSLCVAAASIVAKVYRDQIMTTLHARFPYYNWASNKGYPCEAHFEGIDKHGIQIGIHRTRTWPFNYNPKHAEAGYEKWAARRNRWRKVTAKQLGLELGEELWTTKPPSLIHSLSSNDYQQKKTKKKKRRSTNSDKESTL